jgi:outer membrane protein TolC/ABC-type uncharacterized transport system substrate-binding protein
MNEVSSRTLSRCFAAVLLLSAIVTPCFTPTAFSQDAPAVSIGFLLDGPSDRNDDLRQMVEGELRAMMQGEFDVSFPVSGRHVGDWSIQGMSRAGDEALADSELDLLIALGLGASMEVAGRGPLPLPVVAAQIIDASSLDLLTDDQRSAVPNLSIVDVTSRGAEVVRAFIDLADVSRVAVIVHEMYRSILADIATSVGLVAEEQGLELVFVWVAGGPEEIVQALPANVDGVVLAPTLHLSVAQSKQLAQAFIERRLPSFSMFGGGDLELGHLATLASDSDSQRLARRTALNVQRILLGQAPEDIPVRFDRTTRLAINIATARAIRVWPRYDLLVDAVLINPDPEPEGDELTIVDAVREALSMNLDLTAVEHFISAGISAVDAARSSLLPQIDALLGVSVIDRDRAAGSAGMTARRTWEAGVRLEQLLYSETVYADVDISELTQEAREWLRRELILDVTQSTAIAYLDVLRNKTLERIRRDDLALTRSNVDLAQTRLRIGVANRSEVFRWEAQLATSQRSLVRTSSQLRVSEILLQRLLHRPLGESLRLVETGLDDPVLFPRGRRIERAIDDPWSLAVFEEFLVQQAMLSSPELRQIELEEEIGERLLESRHAAYWSPTAGLSLQRSRDFHLGGRFAAPAGSTPPDRNDWTAALSASFPLYTGGARAALLRQSQEERARLAVERAATAERIEQSVRTAVQLAMASHTSIRLSEQAASAARSNLDLVRDSYGRGVLSVLDLLDAQSAELTARLESAAASHDFLIDLMNVQRAAGEFSVFLNPMENEAWEAAVLDALRRAGVEG